MGPFRARDSKPLGRLLPWVVCGLLGCGGDGNDPGPTGPGEGALEVVTSTTGSPANPDGYSVKVDDLAARSQAPNAADTVAALSPGPHTVLLAGLTGNCVLESENPRTVEIAAGEMVSVRFDVTCHPALQVSVSTTGSELDPDGFDLSIDGDVWGSLPPNGAVIVPFLSPGPHTIALSGLAPNCAVSGEHPRTVDIVEGEAVPGVELDVVCNPAGTLEVGVATSAGDPDPDGYVVTLNGGPRMGIGAEGGRFEFLTPGDYTVALSDVAPNCNLSGPNTATATLVSGGSATVNFTVSCGPLVTVPPDHDIALESTNDIYLLSADGSRFVNLTNHPDGEFDAIWSPDGKKLAFSSGHDVITDPLLHQRHFVSHVFVMNADGSERTQLTNGDIPEPASRSAGEQGPDWSPDGSRIAYIGTRPDSSYHIFVINADGSGQTQLTTGGDVSLPFGGGPAWSPDGTKLAYPGRSSLDHPGILVINADGSGMTQLTDGHDSGPAWSPDGTKIAFLRAVLGRSDDIYVVNADGSGLTLLSSDTSSSRRTLSWSPDGTKILFERSGTIYLVNGTGTGLAQLTFGPPAILPTWSPDGSKIAYYLCSEIISCSSDQTRLYLMNLDGSGEVPLAPPAEQRSPPSFPAAWRP